MSKGRILKMALDEIVGGVKKVDLGDLTKKVNVGDRVEAVKRMLGDAGEKVAEKADDWGWKGGKPGELTGGMYDELVAYKSRPEYLSAETKKWLNNWMQSNPRETRLSDYALDRAVVDQIRKSPVLSARAAEPWGASDLMDDFYMLEQAGIPREWTGKLAEALPPIRAWQRTPLFGSKNAPIDLSLAVEDLSDTMRQMTNDQREAFVALLPEWSGSLDELAEAARTL